MSNVLLLWCVSVMVGASVFARYADVANPDEPLPAGWSAALTAATIVTVLVFLATEWFSGIRWVAVIATVTVGFAIASMYLRDLASGGVLILWLASWLAVVYWFAHLAASARADR